MDRAHRIGQRKEVYVYRLVSVDTVEEKIVQRQAVRLKMDQVFIQHGRKATSNMPLNKEEYEKIVFHGSMKIMAAKTDMINFGADIDIESLIAEGMERNRIMNTEANE